MCTEIFSTAERGEKWIKIFLWLQVGFRERALEKFRLLCAFEVFVCKIKIYDWNFNNKFQQQFKALTKDFQLNTNKELSWSSLMAKLLRFQFSFLESFINHFFIAQLNFIPSHCQFNSAFNSFRFGIIHSKLIIACLWCFEFVWDFFFILGNKIGDQKSFPGISVETRVFFNTGFVLDYVAPKKTLKRLTTNGNSLRKLFWSFVRYFICWQKCQQKKILVRNFATNYFQLFSLQFIIRFRGK